MSGDTSTGGEGRPSFGIITQQIPVGVTRRHQVGVDDAPHDGDLINVGLREGVRHTFVGPKRAQAPGHAAHKKIGLPVVSS